MDQCNETNLHQGQRNSDDEEEPQWRWKRAWKESALDDRRSGRVGHAALEKAGGAVVTSKGDRDCDSVVLPRQQVA